MDSKDRPAPPVTTAQLHSLRKATERVSDYLRKQTTTYLNVLRPSLVPQRLLGRYIENPDMRTVTGADKAWSRLTTRYKRLATKPFSISSDLQSPLPPIDPVVELHPWEYAYEVKTDAGPETISVYSPAKWIVCYRSSLTPVQFRQAVDSDPARQKKQIQQFVVNSLVIAEVLKSLPGLEDLFTALRLKLSEENYPETGALPYVTLTWSVASYLPDDEIVSQTTQLSGVPRFTELIDTKGIGNLPDPLREQLQALI